MKFRFCVARILDNDPRPLVYHNRLPSKHWVILTFPSSEDFFEDIEASYPFISRRMMRVPSMKTRDRAGNDAYYL